MAREVDYLVAAEAGYFRCIPCDKVLRVTSARAHYSNAHDIDASGWDAVKQGKRIQNTARVNRAVTPNSGESAMHHCDTGGVNNMKRKRIPRAKRAMNAASHELAMQQCDSVDVHTDAACAADERTVDQGSTGQILTDNTEPLLSAIERAAHDALQRGDIASFEVMFEKARAYRAELRNTSSCSAASSHDYFPSPPNPSNSGGTVDHDQVFNESCPLCGMQFDSVDDALSHDCEYADDSQNRQCDHCGDCFTTWTDMFEHVCGSAAGADAAHLTESSDDDVDPQHDVAGATSHHQRTHGFKPFTTWKGAFQRVRKQRPYQSIKHGQGTIDNPDNQQRVQSAVAAVPSDVQGLAAELQKLLGIRPPGELEVTTPTISVVSDAESWHHELWNDAALRHDWPITLNSAIDTSECARYLRTRSKDAQTTNIYVQGVTYLFSLVHVDWKGEEPTDNDLKNIGCIAAMYKQNLFTELLDLPILGSKYPWTLKIAQSLQHFCEHLIITCKRNNFREAERVIDLFSKDSVAPLLTECGKQKLVRGFAKETRDTISLDNFAPIADVKLSVRTAMIDMVALSGAVHSGANHNFDMSHAATIAMTGILYLNSPMGRPGEMKSMKTAAIAELISTKGDCLVCVKHKTGHKHGETGKYVPPGTLAAMSLYINLPDRHSELFLQPARASTAQIGIAKYLARYCEIYLPTHGSTVPTLLQKFYNTSVNEDIDKAKEMVATTNANTSRTADKNYTLRRAKIAAAKGKRVADAVLGGSVEWPTGASDVTEAFLQERLQILSEAYARTKKGVWRTGT